MASPPLPPEPAAGLENMEGLVLDTVISKAGARPAAALACASTRLRAAVADESLWRRFCAEDLGLDAPIDPDGRPLPSFQAFWIPHKQTPKKPFTYSLCSDMLLPAEIGEWYDQDPYADEVKVRASGVFVPEYPQSPGPQRSFMHTYSIRMSVPEAIMLGGVYYSSCQLHSRHWTIRSRDIVVSDVGGEGVIGQYPVLSPGQDEFVYESCTPLPEAPGSVEGSFSFVPGKLSRPEGKPFEVKVAPFPLEVPEYIF
nr:unnamed protein product [Digitaria exilis]